MALIRNVFPPQVHPLNKCSNTQTSVTFDKTSISNKLCPELSASPYFPLPILPDTKKHKQITLNSTSLGGFVTHNDALGSSEERGGSGWCPPQWSQLWPRPPHRSSVHLGVSSQLRLGPKEGPAACTRYPAAFGTSSTQLCSCNNNP